MRKIKPLLVTLVATAALAGGGAAIASAATSSTTTGSTSTTPPAHTTTTPRERSNPAPSQGNSGNGHHCPNMGAASNRSASPSAF